MLKEGEYKYYNEKPHKVIRVDDMGSHLYELDKLHLYKSGDTLVWLSRSAILKDVPSDIVEEILATKHAAPKVGRKKGSGRKDMSLAEVYHLAANMPKRGRPKGVKNKTVKAPFPKKSGKRGRPKGSKNKK